MTGGRRGTIILFNIAMLTTSIIAIMPEYAAELLKKNTFNRPVNQATVDDYAAQMEKGLWRLNGEPIIIASTGDVLDGQHRLLACIKSNSAFTTFVSYGVDAEVFDTIDTGRKRTPGDIFNIAGIKSATVVSSICSYFFNIKKSNYSTVDQTQTLRDIKVSKHEILEFYKSNTDLIDRVCKMALKCYSSGRFLSTSVIGAYALYLILEKKHAEEKVFNFFYEVFEVLPDKNVSTNTLRGALLRHVLKQYVLSPVQKAAYIKKTWNAYVKNKEIKRLNYNKDVDSTLQFI